MATFLDIANKVGQLNIIILLQQLFSNDQLAKQVVTFITERLYAEGTTGIGIELETDRAGRLYPYANKTVRIKQEGSPTKPVDRVTLNQTDAFYESIFVEVQSDGFIIGGNFTKENGHIHDNFQNSFSTKDIFEKSVLSLTENEFKIILEKFIKQQLPIRINEKLKLS